MSPRPSPRASLGTPPRVRDGLSAALIVLACLLLPFGALAAWAAYGLTDTGRYVRTMAPLAGDPAVRDAFADAVGAELTDELEPRLRGMAGPFVRDAARSFTRTDAFRAGWDTANRVTHTALLHAVRQDAGGRPVTVDIAPVAAEVKRRLAAGNVPFAHRIPVPHTEVAVLPAPEADRLRKGYDVLEVAAFWLPSTTVALAVTGIAIAACRRRAVVATALGTALGGALLALAIAVGRHLTLTDLPAGLHRPAAEAVYDALTATLRTASWLLLALGLTAATITWLTGRHSRGARRAHACAPAVHGSAPEPTRTRA
ncbi:Integral membrane protein OS=Streptomyces glaucescens OX=1907 GN=SGLAU_17730 PE=4 SV=1 [Streptomyces glaucescens]